MHPAIIIGTVRSLWTWLWGRYHVSQNVFLVIVIFLAGERVTRRRVFVLVYVHSAPEHYVQRLLLRQTWANPRLYDHDIRIAFFVGRRSRDAVMEQAVRLEAAQFGDIIQAVAFLSAV